MCTLSILKWLLNICSLLFCLYAIFSIFSVIVAVFKSIMQRNITPLKELVPRDWPRKEASLLFWGLVLLAGAVNFVLSYACASTEIGAFYEKGTYEESYEAYLRIDETLVFCIVDIEKYEGTYHIWSVHLPYGRTIYPDEEYNPESTNTYFWGNWKREHDCTLELQSIATDASYEYLKNVVPLSRGECCASRESDIYHFVGCQYVKEIKPKNLIYFESVAMADIFDFELCDVCDERGY